VEQQLRRLSIGDEPGAEAAVPESRPLTIRDKHLRLTASAVDPRAAGHATGWWITHTPSHEACLARGGACSSRVRQACPSQHQPQYRTVEPPPAATRKPSRKKFDS